MEIVKEDGLSYSSDGESSSESDSDTLSSDESNFQRRGKGREWYLFKSAGTDSMVKFNTSEDVEKFAVVNNISKRTETCNNMYYYCKVKGCPHVNKMSREHGDAEFFLYYSGQHDHPLDQPGRSVYRGLSNDQKVIVRLAFLDRKCSPGAVVAFFQDKRGKLGKDEVLNFPPDPVLSILKNYLAKYKKSLASKYRPSYQDLKDWCITHSPSTVDKYNVESYNTPFVLNYHMVNTLSSLYHAYLIYIIYNNKTLFFSI